MRVFDDGSASWWCPHDIKQQFWSEPEVENREYFGSSPNFFVILFVFVIVFGLAHINQASLLLLLAGVLNASCVDENSCHFSIKSLTGPLNRGVIWTADKRDLPTFGSGRFHGFQELGDIYFFWLWKWCLYLKSCAIARQDAGCRLDGGSLCS